MAASYTYERIQYTAWQENRVLIFNTENVYCSFTHSSLGLRYQNVMAASYNICFCSCSRTNSSPSISNLLRVKRQAVSGPLHKGGMMWALYEGLFALIYLKGQEASSYARIPYQLWSGINAFHEHEKGPSTRNTWFMPMHQCMSYPSWVTGPDETLPLRVDKPRHWAGNTRETNSNVSVPHTPHVLVQMHHLKISS